MDDLLRIEGIKKRRIELSKELAEIERSLDELIRSADGAIRDLKQSALAGKPAVAAVNDGTISGLAHSASFAEFKSAIDDILKASYGEKIESNLRDIGVVETESAQRAAISARAGKQRPPKAGSRFRLPENKRLKKS